MSLGSSSSDTPGQPEVGRTAALAPALSSETVAGVGLARILLVEDDDVLRKTLARLLTRSGYAVTEAGNGRAALQEMSRLPANLVVTDLIMPEMEGIEMIRLLRRQYPGIKIIAISGGGLSPAEGYLKIARNVGVQKTFTKPFTSQELLDAIRELLEAK